LVILKESDKIYIIPKGEQFKAIFDDRLESVSADDDMVAMYKGTYLKLIEEANINILK